MCWHVLQKHSDWCVHVITRGGEIVLAGRDLKNELKAGREALDASLIAVLTAEQQEFFSHNADHYVNNAVRFDRDLQAL